MPLQILHAFFDVYKKRKHNQGGINGIFKRYEKQNQRERKAGGIEFATEQRGKTDSAFQGPG
jgi:hypothetical protein